MHGAFSKLLLGLRVSVPHARRKAAVWRPGLRWKQRTPIFWLLAGDQTGGSAAVSAPPAEGGLRTDSERRRAAHAADGPRTEAFGLFQAL